MSWPLTQPKRDEVPEEEVSFYDQVIERALIRNPGARQDAGYYGRLLHSPEFAARLSSLGAMVRKRGDRSDSYSHADREFVDQVLAEVLGTNQVLRMHIPDAVSAGVRLEAIEALRAGDRSRLTERERNLADFIEAVVSGGMTADLWNRLDNDMGTRSLLELTIFTLFLQLTMRLQQAVGMSAPADSEIDQLIEDLKSGRVMPPDFRERIN
jgi:alkylhydroperoxidase family enzyme